MHFRRAVRSPLILSSFISVTSLWTYPRPANFSTLAASFELTLDIRTRPTVLIIRLGNSATDNHLRAQFIATAITSGLTV
ncbi:uncharacterized protein LAJ45_07485 [Morchella importuna]|uniref:uncharacterized protein n=1 Tax=Morchella importuna TaxID=1174673 RepID=UPI001E8CE72C|nr:uncharacterized protein LAJ45_07485 [Morchella importuna]KAH8148384.1 hypothetical protein LAJ45_07485 [Morchella importuna]